ncbi:MAG: acyl-ACP--UDP-N-acetylglucosamine O-acyltransferase [Kiritimatiellia bacterium]|jgi:UDP-N-acetylglucosamine acyltransferase
MSQIHPTAVIEDGAQLGNGVVVGPYAVIGPNVVLGDGCKIFAHAMVSGHTTLGAGCEVHPFAHIGGKTQDLKYAGGTTHVDVGERTVMREYVTINCGTSDGEVTRVGSDCLLMAYVHLAHGCVFGDHVIVSNATQFAGEVTVGDHAVISGLCGVHQFCRIGCHAMIGASSLIVQDAAPYLITGGNPAEARSINLVGLTRRGFPEETRNALKSAHKLLCRSGLNVSDAIAEIEKRQPMPPEVATLVDFFKSTQRGVIR